MVVGLVSFFKDYWREGIHKHIYHYEKEYSLTKKKRLIKNNGL